MATEGTDERSAASPQAFWLAHLGGASRFNRWVFSQFAAQVGGSVLEIGCGTGTYTALIAGRASRVVAVDLEPAFVETAARETARFGHVETVCGDALAMSWRAEFDAIVMLDVLEHIADDLGALIRLRSFLRPGGRLIVKVPAGAWLYSEMDRAIGHHRRYSRRSLRDTLTRAGYRPERLWAFNAPGILGWWLNGKLLGRATPPREQIDGFERIVPPIRLFERVLPPPVGLSCFALATPATPADPAQERP